jgi:Domain of unknown function (DUF1842)
MGLDLYQVKFMVGNRKMSGAPLLHVQALVDAQDGQISGQAEITQSVVSPGNSIRINNLRGRLYPNGINSETRLVTLDGTYEQPLPPPAIGTVELRFEAVLYIDKTIWKGYGSFSYGGDDVINVPVVPSGAEEED